MRAVLVLLLLAATAAAAPDTRKADPDTRKAGPAAGKPAEPPAPSPTAVPPRKPGPDDAKAAELLGKIVAGPDAAARRAAIDELTRLAAADGASGEPERGGSLILAIREWVDRPHATEQADRRAVLAEIHAAVPDKNGRFSTPPRQTGKQLAADDDLDWLKALLELDQAMTGAGEAIADVAAIRALAATRDPRAAAAMFDIAFGEDSIIYRDEVGRYLRKMEPYSVPPLTREAQIAKDANRRRYATWQLERLDRQDPLKALAAAAGDERLMIAVLDAFRATRHREAVHAVWSKVDDDSPGVRAAARAAWMDYITGPPPKPAPRKKLMLPGGKLTKKEKPLWLTYRELADTELRKAANELLHEDYPLDDETRLDDKEVYVKKVKIDLPEVTKRLFEHFDSERARKEAAELAAARTKADAGDLQTAAAMLDRLLATNPDRGERAAMAEIYARWGKRLEDQQQWAEASAAYSKAHGLDPKGPAATDRLAAHHYALGKSLEAQGKDGGPDFRRAIALKPDYAPAQTAAERAQPAGRPTWMLLAAIGAAVIGMALFGAAMLRRRAA